jgi:hypothetical protein
LNNLVEIIKQNWLIGLLAIVGLVVINFSKIISIIKPMLKNNAKDEDKKPIEVEKETKLRKSSLLPSIFENVEDLVEELESKGFVKSSAEAKSLLKTIINEYPEI